MSEGYTASVWTVIAAGGGRWQLAEVQRALPSIAGRHVKLALRTMLGSQALQQFPDGSYGVTGDCKIPRGMTVAEVLKATGAAGEQGGSA